MVTERRDPSPDPETVFAALDDESCREILAALEEPRTAKALAEETDIALSTVYKKLDLLVTAALLEERTEVDPNGHHRSQYVVAFDDITVWLDVDRQLLVDIEAAPLTPDDKLAEMWSQVREQT